MSFKELGRIPSGKRLERIKKSIHFKDGAFQNIHFTPQLVEGYTGPQILFNFLFKKPENLRPKDVIPSIKTSLKELPLQEDLLVWFGHSSYYLQLNGKKILVDPVFSNSASPIPGTNKPFKGSNVYGVADMPEIDYLLISHDHYDHLDYKTIAELRKKVGKVITGLGVGEHFKEWGYNPESIVELDWERNITLEGAISLYTTSARHFSGRTFKRNKSLWLSFILKTENLSLFLGGDSGYDTHFKEIGHKFGPFDLAILENGQYNPAWHFIHMCPEETFQAAKDLKAKSLLPVHNGKFALALHPWKEPLELLSKQMESSDISLLTPLIGEVLKLNNLSAQFPKWWEKIT